MIEGLGIEFGQVARVAALEALADFVLTAAVGSAAVDLVTSSVTYLSDVAWRAWRAWREVAG